MSDDIYIYLTTSDVTSLYPASALHDFRIKLAKQLNFHDFEKWSVALLDIDIPKFEDGYRPRFITFFSSICQPTIYNSSLKPVLQRAYNAQLRGGGRGITFIVPRYVPLNTDALASVDLIISDDQGRIPSFRRGHLSCTLHLRRSRGVLSLLG